MRATLATNALSLSFNGLLGIIQSDFKMDILKGVRTYRELDLPAPFDYIVNKPFVYGLSLDGRSATLQGAIVEKRGFKYGIELD